MIFLDGREDDLVELRGGGPHTVEQEGHQRVLCKPKLWLKTYSEHLVSVKCTVTPSKDKLFIGAW